MPPLGLAAPATVRRALRMVKHMNAQGSDWAVVHEASRRALERALEEAMESDLLGHLRQMDRWGAPDRRNGSYRRELLTRLGPITVAVLRTRTHSARGVLRAYARREPQVDRLILAAFLLGLSTRKVGEALLPLLGVRVSPSTVSRIAAALDAAVASFHQRALADRYPVLLLDGVVLSRKTGAGALRRPVLVALGITESGAKEVIDFELVEGESQRAWERFLSRLEARGLSGKKLRLVVSDGGPGLTAALPTVFPDVPRQRCWAHKSRNVLEKARRADRPAMKRDLQRISHAENRTAARRAARRFADRWQAHYPRAVQCLRGDLDELLSFFLFDDPAWRLASRTTNAIERRFREVRRRTRPMGVFSDRTSMERVLFAVFSYENYKQRTGCPFLLLTQET